MDFEKEIIEEKEPFDFIEKDPEIFEEPEQEFTKSGTKAVSDPPQYFTNIDGIYAKDVDGRAETAELRTMIDGTYVRAYTVMPVIDQTMLGQIAQYVGTTDANYTQGYFYIAASDGATEPTYSWVHLPTQNGYSETVLYTASSPHTNNIELSQAYTNFDEIVIVWKYSSPDPDTVDNYSVRYIKTYKVSTFGDGVVFLCGEETSAAQAFIAYILGDTTHINYDSKIGTLYNWIAKVIGIKYGSNGGAVANPVRSLAKSKEEEKPIEEEEPTDEMR